MFRSLDGVMSVLIKASSLYSKIVNYSKVFSSIRLRSSRSTRVLPSVISSFISVLRLKLYISSNIESLCLSLALAPMP